jgi:hypothetical protein
MPEINNNYLSGYLQETLRQISNLLIRHDLIDSDATGKVRELMEKELAKALRAERRFTLGEDYEVQ